MTPAVASRPLMESVVASGRYVYITTYHDGPNSPIRASLLFHSAEDAAECARVMRATMTEPVATCVPGCVRLASEGPGHPGACSTPGRQT